MEGGRKAKSSVSEDSDRTANVDKLAWSKRGLVVGDARSGDCTGFGDCGGDGGGRSKDESKDCAGDRGDDGGDENDFDDDEDIVSSGELDGSESGFGVCEGGSEDRMRLRSCARGLETVDDGLVDPRSKFQQSVVWLGRFGGE